MRTGHGPQVPTLRGRPPKDRACKCSGDTLIARAAATASSRHGAHPSARWKVRGPHGRRPQPPPQLRHAAVRVREAARRG